jgi:hypothetical protein
MSDLTWDEFLYAHCELFIARSIVRWYRWRGRNVQAVAWAYKHYGREGSKAVLRP